jgi:flavin reductase (DIM6/NTAB) family NADH-FMN oxidoreductase RutF
MTVATFSICDSVIDFAAAVSLLPVLLAQAMIIPSARNDAARKIERFIVNLFSAKLIKFFLLSKKVLKHQKRV